MDLNDMLIFAKVAEMKGISPAARALNVPKSKISRRMAALEEALGARLLERSTRSVHLTEVGNIFYQHCKRIEEEASSARESVNQMLDTPRGHLYISASIAMGQQIIAPYLGEFCLLYPEIEVEINLDNRRVDMIADGFDLVIRVGDLQDSSLISKKLGSSRAKVYASPNYLAQSKPVREFADLEEHRMLVMTDGSRVHQWAFENHEGDSYILDNVPNVSINDLTMLRNAAEGGAGIVSLPIYLAEEAIAKGRLVDVFPDWHSPEFSYYAIYPSHRGLTRKVRVWIDFFAEKLKKNQ